MDQVFKNNLVLILIWYLQCYSFSPIVQKNKGIFQVFVVGDAYYWTEISRDQKLLLIFFPVGNLQKKTKKPSAKVFCSKKNLWRLGIILGKIKAYEIWPAPSLNWNCNNGDKEHLFRLDFSNLLHIWFILLRENLFRTHKSLSF